MGAPDLLANLTAIGVTVATHSGNLIVHPWSLVSDGMRQALRSAKPELIELLSATPARRYMLTPAEADAAHAHAWDDGAIDRFRARAGHLRRLAFSEQDAEDLAERLHLRDVEHDDRAACIECKHYRARRCSNRAAAGLRSAEVGHDLAVLLQHCTGFSAKDVR